MRESPEMYLETILVLKQKNTDGIHAIDVAKALGYSKPSVSKAFSRLKESGLIEIDANDHIILLPKGEQIARAVYERHEVLTDILIRLGVPKETATKDACRIEHVISQETFDVLKEIHLRLNENAK